MSRLSLPRHWAAGHRDPLDGQPDLRAAQNEFTAWSTRSLADIELDYLYLTDLFATPRLPVPSRSWSLRESPPPSARVLVSGPGRQRRHDPGSTSADLTNRGPAVAGAGHQRRRTGWSARRSPPFHRLASNAVWSTASATCSPRSQSTPKPRSKARTGRSSTTSSCPPARPRSWRPPARCSVHRPLRASLSSRVVCLTSTRPSSRCICGVPRRALQRSATPTCLERTSARPVGGPRSSVAPWRTVLPQAGLGGSRPREQGLARPDLHPAARGSSQISAATCPPPPAEPITSAA